MEVKRFDFLFLSGLLLVLVGAVHCQQEGKVSTVDICREKPGGVNGSKPYCSCKEDVISCDFSTFTNQEEYEFNLNGWNDNSNANIKRLCFCGGQKRTHFEIKPNVFNGLRHLHRVDFYNMPGVIHFRGAFTQYFSGDLYMHQVRVNTIHPLEFGPGDPFTIEDVSSIKCCSKIDVKQKFQRPVLHVQNSKFGKISSNGLNNGHLWKTVVLTNVSVASVEPYGIKLQNWGMDVSIINCTFGTANASSIIIQDAANVLMTRNVFKNTTHDYALGAVSHFPSSNLILLENYFHNGQIAEFDASKVLSLFNHFTMWDNYTFASLQSAHPDRIYYMALNAIKRVQHFYENSIPEAGKTETRVFGENVLGECQCNFTAMKFPSVLTDSRCEYHTPSKANEVCNPKVEEVAKICRSQGKVQVDCYSEEKLARTNMDYMKLIQGFLSLHHSALNSTFIMDMLLSSPYSYEVTTLEESEPATPEKREWQVQHNLGSSVYSPSQGLLFPLVALLWFLAAVRQ